LLGEVRAAGLLDRRRGFYLALTAALLTALAAVVAGVVVTGHSWMQLLLAAALGVVLAQLGFVAHEAAHREVFESGRANDAFGRVIADLIVGISFSSWKVGHNRHHSHPNTVGRDPSVAAGVFAFREEDAAAARGAYAAYLRRQGILYYPILLLAGVNFYRESFGTVLGRGTVERRATEIVMLTVRSAALLALVFSVMGPGLALAFLAVHLVVFGLCTASAFIVNHIGMPVLPPDARTDYLRRQVLTSRNIRGGWLTTAWMGGLNFQIEHHLFPSMARPQLRAAARLVRRYCAEHGIPYTETGLLQAYRTVSRHMDEVGRAAGRGFSQCPTAGSFGR